MKIAFYSDTNTRGHSVITAAYNGLVRLGHECFFMEPKSQLPYCEAFVCIAWNDVIRARIEECHDKKIKVLSLSDGYLKRGTDVGFDKGYFAVTRYNINYYGKHVNRNLDKDRWNKLEIELKPWKKKGSYYVIAHQFALTAMNKSRRPFFDYVINECKKTNKQVLIVKHPRQRTSGKTSDLEHKANNDFNKYKRMGCQIIESGKSLKFLSKAFMMITHDSNTSVESIINGIPTLAGGKSMIDQLKSPTVFTPLYKDRTDWCNWIAHQQWTLSELRNGEILRKYYGF